MKIMFILTGLGMGGAERQVCALADTFTKLGHEVMLVSMTGETVNRPEYDSIKVIELAMSKSIVSVFNAYFKLNKLIRNFRPDIVHSHMVHANIFSRLVRISTRIPRLICTAHSTNEGGSIRMWAYRVTDSLCDLTTNVSQEAVDKFVSNRAVKKDKVVTIYNGIDTEYFCLNTERRTELRLSIGVADDTKLLLAVGRLSEAKDYPNLLRSFSYVLKTRKDLILVIIGIGEKSDYLNKLSVELNIAKNVRFLGLRLDVSDWMNACDLYLMSSAWEGMPLVLLEAMACERVVVVTDCGGVKEVIQDAGFLVPPKDSQKLASAISTALKLPSEKRVELGVSARSRIVENYSLQAICLKWLQLYCR